MTRSDDRADSRQTYNSTAVVAHYRDQPAALHEAEVRLLGRFANDVEGRRVLDIGIGAGRTVPTLAARAGSYVGIDYADELVAVARQRHPDLDLRVGDVRSLLDIPSESMDFVLFSFNGIDSVPHRDRQEALAEIHRVLAPGGRFLFSSHNLGYGLLARPPWSSGRPGRSMVRRTLHFARHAATRRAMAREEISGDGWALVNDGAHDFALLIYYVSPAEQLRQLAEAGFVDPSTFDQAGNEAEDSPTSIWMYYSARKGR